MNNYRHRRYIGAPRPVKKSDAIKKYRKNTNESNFFKTAFYFAIIILTVLSFFLILDTGNIDNSNLSENTVSFKTVNPLIDASGQESVFDESLIDPKFILAQEMPVIYGVDLEEIYLENKPDLGGAQGQADIYFDVLPEEIKLEILEFTNDTPKEFYVGAKGPQILIYHTHTQEAYRQVTGEEYVETGAWRTGNEDFSVVAVGSVLEAELEEYGYTVLHDTTNHEPPKLSSSYSRSVVTMEKYADEYPTICVFIDVHRDAYGDVEKGKNDFVTVDGDECARVMFVVGTGEGKTGQGFSDKPNYESNYKLALAVTNQLESIKKGFTRPIRVKTGRYNQHVSDMCLLIEVGHNANSLQQALNTAKYVALALSRVLEPN